jgi:hypothetical protein
LFETPIYLESHQGCIFQDFYRYYIKELYDLSLFKAKVTDALKVIKKTEEVSIKYLNEQDMVINNLINEAIDILVGQLP